MISDPACGAAAVHEYATDESRGTLQRHTQARITLHASNNPYSGLSWYACWLDSLHWSKRLRPETSRTEHISLVVYLHRQCDRMQGAGRAAAAFAERWRGWQLQHQPGPQSLRQRRPVPLHSHQARLLCSCCSKYLPALLFCRTKTPSVLAASSAQHVDLHTLLAAERILQQVPHRTAGIRAHARSLMQPAALMDRKRAQALKHAGTCSS